MMSPKQNRRYWRDWSKAVKMYCRANDIDSMTAADATVLRYKLHAAAGLPKSHLDFNGDGDATKIFKWFAHLARTGEFENFVDIADAAEETERTRMLRKVNTFPEAYFGAIVFSVTRGSTRDPEELQTWQLRNLVIRLEDQARKNRRALVDAELERAAAAQPTEDDQVPF